MAPAPSTSESPRRTTLGVFVHLTGLVFGFIGPGVAYLLSDDTFTKANARNALNWQIVFVAAFLLLVVTTFGLSAVFDLFGVVGTVGILLLFFVLNPAFCLWATFKASRGKSWNYPLAPNLV